MSSSDDGEWGEGGGWYFHPSAYAQEVFDQSAELDWAERSARTTYVVPDNGSTRGLPTQVSVPARLGEAQRSKPIP